MKLFAFTLGTALLSGCALFSINPTLELAKAGGAAALRAVSTGPSSANNSFYHEHAAMTQLVTGFDH
jgi:hypothetical protein